jgi:beta-glucosidase
MNEPTVPLNKGYLAGVFPPGKIDPWSYFQARKNMIEGHIKCYKLIKKSFPHLPVGITQFCNTFENRGFLKKWVEKFQDFYNWGFAGSDKNCHDFIGIDYYATFEPKFFPPSIKRKTTRDRWTDIDWGIYPRGIYEICMDAHKKFKKPIYIFENGLADAEDRYRADFVKEHLEYLKKAIDEGADVRGYFHWSLLDNFEWNLAYGPKFGLCEVDFKTMERKPRGSYYVYKEIIDKNRV